MKKMPLVFLVSTSLTLLGCNSVGSEFSCKESATDSCLTIEQVDSMTRFADGVSTRPRQDKARIKKVHNHFQQQALVEKGRGEPIWLAKTFNKTGHRQTQSSCDISLSTHKPTQEQ